MKVGWIRLLVVKRLPILPTAMLIYPYFVVTQVDSQVLIIIITPNIKILMNVYFYK